jgi:ATP adenylyltransferase
MLEHLWSGWRLAYITTADAPPADPSDTRSVFTRVLQSGLPDDETFVVHRARTCFVVLNLYPYSTAHMLVLPYREVPDLEDLDADETRELWATVTDAVRAVKRAYQPEGVNVGLNLGRPAGGSISQHLHVHVVPRWTGDANFMTACANTRTIPEALPDTWARLRAAWGEGVPSS